MNNIILLFVSSLVSISVLAETNIHNDPFLNDKLDKKNWEPGGEHFPKDYNRGDQIFDKWGNDISRIVTHKKRIGNILIQHADIAGEFGYTIDLNWDHPLNEHSPFANETSNSGSYENKTDLNIRQTKLNLNWTGYLTHPADGYDGGNGAGGRDFARFKVEGNASAHYYNPTTSKDESKTNTVSLYYRDAALGYNHAFVVISNQYNESFYIGGGPSITRSDKKGETDWLIGDYLEAYTNTFDSSLNSLDVDAPKTDYDLYTKNNYEKDLTAVKASFKDDSSSQEDNFLSRYVRAVGFVNHVNRSDIEYETHWSGDGEGNSNSVAYQSIEAMGFERPESDWHSPSSGTVLILK